MASTSFALPNQINGRSFSAAAPPEFRRSLRVYAGYATAERSSAGNASQSAASFYEVLGIQTSATCQEIKSAYRKLARSLHPDVASNYGESSSSAAEDFMRVHAAYATLSDPEKRAVYDGSLFRLRRAAAVSVSGGYSDASRRRRTWETDQCW